MKDGRGLTAKTSKGKGRGAAVGGGRPPKPSASQQESIHRARTKGRAALELAVDVLLEALGATKVEYSMGEHGWEPAGEVPDHAIRIRASSELCDRFGIPKQSELISDDPYASFLREVANQLKGGA